jgi:nucleoside-diphosphate-sugar epimerase
VPLAATVGTLLQTSWAVHDRLRPNRPAADPPITRFIVEQMSTAHWFDQRHTRDVLQWRPRISLDDGFEELGRWFRGGQLSS